MEHYGLPGSTALTRQPEAYSSRPQSARTAGVTVCGPTRVSRPKPSVWRDSGHSELTAEDARIIALDWLDRPAVAE